MICKKCGNEIDDQAVVCVNFEISAAGLKEPIK